MGYSHEGKGTTNTNFSFIPTSTMNHSRTHPMATCLWRSFNVIYYTNNLEAIFFLPLQPSSDPLFNKSQDIIELGEKAVATPAGKFC